MVSKKSAQIGSEHCWFVTGSEESEVKKAAFALAAKLSPGNDPFLTDVIDGAATTVDEASARISATLQSILTCPLFGGDKLVWLKNASFFADTIVGRSETVTSSVEKLVKLLEKGLPQGINLLISAPNADKRKGIYKSFLKLSQVSLHDKADFGWNATEADIIEWVAGRAKKRGLKIEQEAMEILTARVGADPGQLDTELEKLALTAPENGVIDAETIRLLVATTRQGGIFDLSNAIVRRDLPAALACVDQLLRQKETAIGLLLAAIVPTLRNLMLVADLLKRHRLSPPTQAGYFAKTLEKLPPQATAHLPRKKDGSINAYPLGLAAVAVRRYRLEELTQGFIRCREVNLQLVSTSIDSKLLLGKLLMEILS